MNLLLLGLGKSTSHCLDFFPGKHQVYVYSDNLPIKDSSEFHWFKSIEEVSKFSIDVAIKSPGIPYNHPIITKLKLLKVPIKGEFDIALPMHTGKRVLVTGTNGKTTTTEMLAHLGKKLIGKFHAVGNNGNPVAEYVKRYPNDDMAIEASSYQLHDNRDFKIDAFLLTSLSTDHLEWHGTLGHYYQSKLRPLYSKESQGCSAYCSNQAWETLIASKLEPKQLKAIETFKEFDEPPVKSNIVFEASHNRMNASLAIAAFRQIYPKFSLHDCIEALTDFKVPRFRYESKVLEPYKIKVINDSKSTNVDSTLAALNSSRGKILLFLGGQAKKESFSRINAFQERISHLFIYGASKERISKDISNNISYTVHNSLSGLLSKPIQLSQFTEFNTILFSPACASFDEFNNFEDRGLFFEENFTIQ